MDQNPTFIHQKNYQSFDTINGDFNFEPMRPSCTNSNLSQLISFQDANRNLKDCTMIKPKDEEELLAYENINSNSFSTVNNNKAMKTLNEYGQQGIRTTIRSPLQAREHVLAEKKRREKLNQQFIALSAIVPGIKKVSLLNYFYFFFYYYFILCAELDCKESFLGRIGGFLSCTYFTKFSNFHFCYFRKLIYFGF